MSAGIIGGIGKMPETSKSLFENYDVSLQMQTGGVDNWQPYSAAGTNCYVYDYEVAQDYPDAGFSETSIVDILPRGTITQALIEGFSWINAAEPQSLEVSGSTKKVVRFFSFMGKPNVDINIVLRIWKPTLSF